MWKCNTTITSSSCALSRAPPLFNATSTVATLQPRVVGMDLPGSLKRTGSDAQLEVPPTTRQKPLMESVPNDLESSIHAKRDNEILADLEREPGVLPDLVFLLCTIVQGSEDILDNKYSRIKNATELVRDHTDLASLLENAWKERSFSTIRNLSTYYEHYNHPCIFMLSW